MKRPPSINDNTPREEEEIHSAIQRGMPRDLDIEIERHTSHLRWIDDKLLGDIVGVRMAIDDIQRALEKISQCLLDNDFQQAAALGYTDVASAFIVSGV